jgi:50S ribosomal protein L16 3-hydroxylase
MLPPMILDKLFGDARRTFLASHFLATPFAKAGGCREFLDALDAEALSSVFENASADVVLGRDGQPWPDAALPKSYSDAQSILAAGGTICVRHAERHSSHLTELAESFRTEFNAPVDIHLHWTAPEKQGFGWHYDAEEVFVLQIAGAKEWWLRKNTVNPWPLMESLPHDMQYEREIMPAMRCLLAAGDVLYVPNGYWHRTAAAETSLSLSVGLRIATGIDLLDFIRSHLTDSLRWRQRLPASMQDGPDDEEKLRTVLTDLGRDMAKALADRPLLNDFFTFWSKETKQSPSGVDAAPESNSAGTCIAQSPSMNTNSKDRTASGEKLPPLSGDKTESGAGLPPTIPDGGESLLSGQPRDLAGDRRGTPGDRDENAASSDGNP